jgi:amino acid adenylation domain-containing protein
MTKPSPIQFSRRSARNRVSTELPSIDWHWDQLGKFDVEFWKGHLAGAPQLLELPTDRPRPSVLSYAGGSVGLAFTPALTAGLRRLSQCHGATLFMTLFAGWAALLSRLSGQSDIVIGTPVANRQRSGSQTPSESLVNTLALRVRLEQDPTVAELLAQIMAITAEAYVHRDVPFAQVLDALQPPRNLSHNPIFQVMLTLDNAPADRELRLHGLRSDDRDQARATAQFDLTLSLSDAGESIVGVLKYARDLFDRSRIERMAGHLLTLFEAMVADDRWHVSELNLLTQAEREQVLCVWNASAARFPTGTLPELLSAQVARTPLAEAVVDGQRVLSYAELDRATDNLASALQNSGVGPETVVGVALNRSLDTVVAAIGILKAGAVYLPLDPVLPEQRLAFMLHDARAVLVLTDETVAARLPGDVPQWRIAQSFPISTPRLPEITPEHLAYIVYTSGSTGIPKGVAVSHASVVNLAFARTRGHDPIGPGDRVLAAISVGFDVSIGQLLLPLLSGACVVIAPDLRGLSAEAFWALLADQRVSHVNSVPSFFDSVLDAAAQQPNLVLKRLMLGGEGLSGALCRRLHAALPNTVVVNMYGPTEACIDATAYVVPDDVERSIAILPIGRPLANYRAYVLDARLRPLPAGVAGELFLSGSGLARGYVGQPGLTAERFLADPFGPPGTRLYRTGDRALWSADGTLMFLGRRDEQVKIRGFRVEPGEIEAALLTHAAIAQAAVIARSDRGSVRLIAYLVPCGPAPAIGELCQHLAQTLPAHMIPAAFVSLDALPLTPNGKLDRRTLPEPDETSVATPRYEAPVGKAETAIARIWQELLGVQRVGRHDNFFDLGGHSLLVLKLVAAIKSEFGRPIAMARVFRSPTPAQLAAVMSEARVHPTWKHLVALNEGGSRTPLFCLNGFDGDVDCYLHIARFVDPSVPVYGLEIASQGDRDTLRETLESRMESYVKEVRGVQPQGPYRLCGFSFGGAEAFDLACRLEQAGEEVVLILLDAYRPSKWLEVCSCAPRLVKLVQSGELLQSARRQLRKLFAIEEHRWLTGKDKDVEQALKRHAMRRKHAPFHGRVILFKSTGIEEWAYQLRLDGRNGWKKYLKGRFDVIQMEAEHSALMKEPTVQSVVGHINRILCDSSST